MQAIPISVPEFDLDASNQALDHAEPREVIAWACDAFGEGLVATTSFGATSAVMLHLIQESAPGTPIICIDTGYLFEETYQFANELRERLDLNLHFVTPRISAARQEALFGKLWEQGEEGVQRYLQMNKVEPLQRALKDLKARAWMAGIRAEQTDHRASVKRIDTQDGRIKIHPILHWTQADIDAYMQAHDLPYHPLYAEGYRSIGDRHSTLPTTADMDPRDGRILGEKRECGIHLPLTDEQNKSFGSSGL